MPTLVWLIDDAESNHRAAAATIAQLPGFELEGFIDGEDALAAYAQRAAHEPQTLPRIVLMDYYMGGLRGDEVTERMRAIHAIAFSPVIVGYSSVASGSRSIVEAGGDTVVRKRIAHDGTNPDLRVYLEGFLGIAGR
ncbi:MAG: response regulator [Planctomycetes bacterium]|nr:response regulator [Planctomycetota bacterium]